MSHWIFAPVILPALAAVTILLGARGNVRAQRTIGGLALLALTAIAAYLVGQAAGGEVHVYKLGDWPAPFGIVLVLDRLSALMVLLTAVVALFSHLYAIHGADLRGPNYHAIFQFQLMGLCGAFLTGDLFNLFVFFEVLLISSYGLLLYAGGRERIRAGIHYVVFNLAGSALFLIGVGTLYGMLGTLNMADMAVKVATVAAGDIALVEAGALILLVVFAVKAAVLPLYFWLPQTYGSATAPVAALFAIMTKVGVYSILRVYTMIFGAGAGPMADLAWPWILPLALATLVAGTLGAMAARDLGGMVAYLVVASVGTMLTAVGLATAASTGAALYYMAHSTFVLAGMFLLVDLVARQRGDTEGVLVRALPVAQTATLGGLFALGAVALAGLPPLSGFVGKVLVLRAALATDMATWVFALVLVTSLLTLIALSRAASMVFWNVESTPEHERSPVRATAAEILPVAALLGLAAVLAALAGPASEYTDATAEQLLHPDAYLEAVLSEGADIEIGAPGADH